MIPISKDEAYLVRKIYPTAEITKTRYHRYLAEEGRYLNVIKKLNYEAQQIIEEGRGCSAEA